MVFVILQMVGNSTSKSAPNKIREQISPVIFKPVFLLSNKTIFKGRVLKEIVGEPCFADYQSPAIGILRNKAPSKDSFQGEGKFLLSSESQH